MNAQAEKLELVQLLLNTESEEVLKKVRAILKKKDKKSETDYLLSSEANRERLIQSIDNLDKGKGKAIKTSDLWK
jgi:PHD/YefM family antitoxin component YafN of YafNO toxin-antitoxin module